MLGFTAFAAAITIAATGAALAQGNPSQPRDTGSMAYPVSTAQRYFSLRSVSSFLK